MGSFDIGYGLAFSGMDAIRNDYVHDTIVYSRSLTTLAVGLSLSLQYRIGNTVRVGVLYQPSFWSPTLSPGFYYQHYVAMAYHLEISRGISL